MSNEIKYNENIIDLIKHLSAINQQLMIQKTEDESEIELRTRNAEQSIGCMFKAPIESFNFVGKEMTFFSYEKFYSYFSLYENPKLMQEDNRIKISSNKSTIYYYLADPKAVDVDYDYIEFGETDATFTLTAKEFKEIKSTILLINTEKINLNVKEDKLKIELYDMENKQNSFSEFDIDNVSGKDFNIEISKEIFIKAPELDYKIHLNSDGIIKFHYINDQNIKLDLYTTELENE
jgi:hypothetical protein